MKKLSLGYAFVADEKGRSMKDVSLLKQGDLLNIHMLNGMIKARIEEIQRLERAENKQIGDDR